MKKFIAASGLLFVLGMASCEKCHTCVVKDNDNVHRYQYAEECGKKKELNAYADRCESEYGAFGYTCSCGETP